MSSIKSLTRIVFVLFIAGGIIPSVFATVGPGSRIGGGSRVSPNVFTASVLENQSLVSTPNGVGVFYGDVVLTECSAPGCNVNDPTNWSEVLRFSDTPLSPPACWTTGCGNLYVSHYQLFSDCNDPPCSLVSTTGFKDSFTGLVITLADLSFSRIGIAESTGTSTTYTACNNVIPPDCNTYTISSDAAETPCTASCTISGGAVPSRSVGGVANGIDSFSLMAPFVVLASVAVAAIATTVIYIRRVERKEEK